MSNSVSLALEIPQEHPAYAGHFPGEPLVPGALLLAWLQALVEREISNQQRRQCKLNEVSSIKFTAPVRPGDSLSIELTQRSDPNKLSLTVTGPNGQACKAVFVLHA
ncbi:MAG: hypothetical protein AB8C02_18580 [Halioglobus sp.]